MIVIAIVTVIPLLSRWTYPVFYFLLILHFLSARFNTRKRLHGTSYFLFSIFYVDEHHPLTHTYSHTHVYWLAAAAAPNITTISYFKFFWNYSLNIKHLNSSSFVCRFWLNFYLIKMYAHSKYFFGFFILNSWLFVNRLPW